MPTAATEEARNKLLAVDCLRSMKGVRTFRQLSQELKLPAGVLNRYINGYVLPKQERADQIITVFEKNYLSRILEAAVPKNNKYIVTADILSQPFLLSVIAHKAAKKFPKVSKVFTAAVDGIPPAQSIAQLLGVQMVYAKQIQEITTAGHYASISTSEKPIRSPFYIPKNLLKKNDHVLIVDDVIRGGSTFNALTSICSQAKADVAGIFALFITKSALKSLEKNHSVSYAYLVNE